MAQRTTLTAAAVALMALAGGQLVAWTTAQASAEPRNPGIVRLQADATDGLRIDRNAAGLVGFVGATASNEVVNPAVSASTGVRSSAQAHLARYGAALGLASDAELSITRSERSVSGQDVVRFQQHVDSAPVIGGQVVVSLRPDRQLGSMLSTVSTLRSLPAATVSEASARTTARRRPLELLAGETSPRPVKAARSGTRRSSTRTDRARHRASGASRSATAGAYAASCSSTTRAAVSWSTWTRSSTSTVLFVTGPTCPVPRRLAPRVLPASRAVLRVPWPT